MKKVGIIGVGKWGEIILSKLNLISNVEIKLDRSYDKNLVLPYLDWIFVTTSVESHFEIVKHFLELGINVFCEKPIAESHNQALQLYKIAESKQLKLYTSDVENYKNNINIKINKVNNILRYKNSDDKDQIVDRLTYHDFTYLYNYIGKKNIKKINIVEYNLGSLIFEIHFMDQSFNFNYNLNKDKAIHMFNNTNLAALNDPLLDMLNSVLYKEINFDENKKISLYSIKMTGLIKKELFDY